MRQCAHALSDPHLFVSSRIYVHAHAHAATVRTHEVHFSSGDSKLGGLGWGPKTLCCESLNGMPTGRIISGRTKKVRKAYRRESRHLYIKAPEDESKKFVGSLLNQGLVHTRVGAQNKVPFFRVVCFFLQLWRFEGKKQNPAKPGYAPKSGWNAFRACRKSYASYLLSNIVWRKKSAHLFECLIFKQFGFFSSFCVLKIEAMCMMLIKRPSIGRLKLVLGAWCRNAMTLAKSCGLNLFDKSVSWFPYPWWCGELRLCGVIRANRFARFARIGWFARIGNSSDSGESAWRAIKLGVSVANDSRESIRANRVANRPCH